MELLQLETKHCSPMLLTLNFNFLVKLFNAITNQLKILNQLHIDQTRYILITFDLITLREGFEEFKTI
jgi:hypothetical protein